MGLRVSPDGSVPEGNGNFDNPSGPVQMSSSSNGRRSPLARTRSEQMAKNILHDVDPWTAWMYKPHTFIVTMAGAALLVWASGAWETQAQDQDTAANIKRGVWATMAVFLLYSLIQAPSTILVRPHPVFWRFIHGIAVIYLVCLTFLLFQSREDARQLLKHVHPDLGEPLKERPYAEDCRIYTPELPNKFNNVYNTVFDEYVAAHTIGWWAKAIMIRNEPMLWTLSIFFEFAESEYQMHVKLVSQKSPIESVGGVQTQEFQSHRVSRWNVLWMLALAVCIPRISTGSRHWKTEGRQFSFTHKNVALLENQQNLCCDTIRATSTHNVFDALNKC